jgi:hypothetical protein
VQFDAEVAACCGPITIPSGSVSDLWRSVRDQVRNLLAQYIESTARSELVRLRATLRAARRSEPSAGTVERTCRVAWSTG